MRNLLIVLVVLAACVIGYGFYANWFSITTNTTGPNKDVKISYDEEKMKADTAKAKEKLQQGVSVKESPQKP
jgi:hypothetical protein